NAKTGTLRVRGVFPNKDETLSPGFFARVRMPTSLPHRALLVSDRALDNDQGQRVLYALNEKDEVVSRLVRVGALHGGLRAFEGGDPGDRTSASLTTRRAWRRSRPDFPTPNPRPPTSVKDPYMLARFFIDRPVLAWVISIVIILLGAIAAGFLPIAEYPEVTPPTVRVTANYPGASAQVVADTVAAPIEQQVVGVEKMLYMSSASNNDGSYTLDVTFEL